MTEKPQRPTYLQVNLNQLKQNLLNIRKHVKPAKVMIMMKANAYGHGVQGVAPYMASLVDYMGVAFVDEGIQLRSLGVKTPIIVLGGTLPEELPHFIEHGLTVSVSSVALLEAAENEARIAGVRLKVHLKIDTGMERTGVHDYEAGEFLERSQACSNLEIEGIYTHLANSEAVDLSHSRLQLDRFRKVLEFYDGKGSQPPPLRHMANSGAILQLPESHLDMVRAGVLFYGVYPGPGVAKKVEVSPAIRWISRVVQSKITLPGRPVSYGSLWSPERPARIITIPCGYGDGYFRRMSNEARVIVGGKAYAQVGRICMDQFMANAVDDDVKVGEEVLLLGRDPSGESVTPEDLASWAGTNEYEVMTNISARVPRHFVTSEQAD
jgi:alanine racemase